MFNFAPYNFYQRPDERYTFGTFAEYEISPGAKPYLEAMFMNDTSNSQIAPSGDFFNSVTTIDCDNPLLSAQELGTICGPGTRTFTGSLNGANGVGQSQLRIGRRNVEGGGRQDHLEHTAFRIVGGMRGDLLQGSVVRRLLPVRHDQAVAGLPERLLGQLVSGVRWTSLPIRWSAGCAGVPVGATLDVPRCLHRASTRPASRTTSSRLAG